MSRELADIITLAQGLSRAEQLRLIQAVAAIVEIQDSGVNAEIEDKWQAEIERRLQEFDSDHMKARPWREVLESMKHLEK